MNFSFQKTMGSTLINKKERNMLGKK